MMKRLIYLICGLVCSLSVFASEAQETELIQAKNTSKRQVKAVKSHGKMCNKEKQMSDRAWGRMLF